MPLIDKSIKVVTDRLPKVISPRAHAVIDYATAASFLGMAAFLWRHNRRAAASCLIAGGAEATLAAFTDYPGGMVKSISLPTHGRIDIGMATLVATMPKLMGFAEDPSARFFSAQAGAIAAVAGLTDFTGSGRPRQLQRFEEDDAA